MANLSARTRDGPRYSSVATWVLSLGTVGAARKQAAILGIYVLAYDAMAIRKQMYFTISTVMQGRIISLWAATGSQ